MVQPKVIMPPWWKDMDFKQENCVPREKSGRHSNLIYLVLNPLKKSGPAFSDFSLFPRCCSFVSSDFSLFSRCVSLCFIDFSMLLHVFHYFSLSFG